MPVISIRVGPKRVHLTAYCPDDELGLLACDYALGRAAEVLNGTREAELRQWLIDRDPEVAELFAKLDAGWKLPKHDEHAIDPSNAEAETRIVRHLIRERMEQCAARKGSPGTANDNHGGRTLVDRTKRGGKEACT